MKIKIYWHNFFICIFHVVHSVTKKLIIWRTVLYNSCNLLWTSHHEEQFQSSFQALIGALGRKSFTFFKTIYQQISESDFIFYRSNNSNLNSVSQIPSTTLLPSSVGYSNWGLVFLSDCFTVALNPGCYTYIAFKEFFNLRILIASNSAFICRYYMIRGTWKPVNTMLLHGLVVFSFSIWFIFVQKISWNALSVIFFYNSTCILNLSHYYSHQLKSRISDWWIVMAFSSPCRHYSRPGTAGRI